jgi:hypothetical protein
LRVTKGAVVVLGTQDDPQVQRVQHEVRQRKGRVALIDTGDFPERLTLSMNERSLLCDGKPLPQNVASVYVRALGINPRAPRYNADLKKRPHGLLAQMDECLALLASCILALKRRGVPIVNDLETNAQHSRKPFQLAVLKNAGLPVPRFLASNNPEEVKAFVRTVQRAVYKPLAGGATVRAVRRSDLTRVRLEMLQAAPVLFQQRVDGVSVRAYVVGGRCVAAAEIHSNELDYRRHEEAVVPARLSAQETRACVAAARACGMQFTGVDLIRGRGRFHILECNPSPMFAVFEDKCGADVAGPLAKLLLR